MPEQSQQTAPVYCRCGLLRDACWRCRGEASLLERFGMVVMGVVFVGALVRSLYFSVQLVRLLYLTWRGE